MNDEAPTSPLLPRKARTVAEPDARRARFLARQARGAVEAAPEAQAQPEAPEAAQDSDTWNGDSGGPFVAPEGNFWQPEAAPEEEAQEEGPEAQDGDLLFKIGRDFLDAPWPEEEAPEEEAQPEAPEAQPEAPEAQPEAPEAQPEAPEEEAPEAPEAQPEAPEEEAPEAPEAASYEAVAEVEAAMISNAVRVIMGHLAAIITDELVAISRRRLIRRWHASRKP